MSGDLPASLKPIKAYLDQAKARASEPVIAYHCRLYALQEAMAMRAKLPKADMGFLLALMDECEQEKLRIGEHDDAGVECENFAQDLFLKADDADRAGRPNLTCAKNFLASAQLMEVCRQFGELPADLEEKIKYAKWRFVEICKAAKENRAPPPPRGLEPSEPAGGSSSGAEPPFDPMAPPVSTVPDASFAPDAPPEYMGLPPPPPPGGVPPAAPAYDPTQPPSYMALPALPDAPPSHVAPPPAAYAAAPPMSGYAPGRTQMLEAMKLCQSANSALQFQDADTAINLLHQAMVVLTQPQPPSLPARPS